MFFTVLMCCNRDEGFFFPAIESVLRQTYPHFELIIVLNNCTDELYDRVFALDDSRIVLLRTHIGQLCFNLNFGLNLSKGEYIVRFDADDLCHPERLEQTKLLISEHGPVDVIAGSCRLISKDGNFLGFVDVAKQKNWRAALKFKNPFVHPAIAIRRDRLLEIRGYSGGFQSEDYDLWLRFSDSPTVSVLTTSFPMIDYRISDFQSRGSRLAYAEVSSYLFRTFLLRPSFLGIISVFASVVKFFVRARK